MSMHVNASQMERATAGRGAWLLGFASSFHIMSQLLKLNPVPLAVDEMRTTDIATCKQPPFSTSPSPHPINVRQAAAN